MTRQLLSQLETTGREQSLDQVGDFFEPLKQEVEFVQTGLQAETCSPLRYGDLVCSPLRFSFYYFFLYIFKNRWSFQSMANAIRVGLGAILMTPLFM